MKFFEAVPNELFSPLASPNRALYADALDVLYTAYRENLKIREDTLYSMLRSRLEQQLADATFEGEDIDDDEQGGLTFEIEKGRLSFRLTAPYSEERKQAASERAKKYNNFHS